jgi:hypothetical protein
MTCNDSNYAADLDGVSTSSYIIQLTDQYVWDRMRVAQPVKYNLISFSSKRQKEVAHSSSEAEYIASASSLKNLLHKQYMMQELGFPQPSMPMFVDNTAVRFMANEWRVTDKSKHINTRYHLLRYHAIKGTIVIYYINTLENIADVGTKPLPFSVHDYLIKKVMEGIMAERQPALIQEPKKRAKRDDK